MQNTTCELKTETLKFAFKNIQINAIHNSCNKKNKKKNTKRQIVAMCKEVPTKENKKLIAE